MTAPVAVVGAGPSGLGCAAVLAAEMPVVLIDRLPVPGGAAGWDGREIRDYVTRVGRLGAQLRLGETALRWDGGRLLLAAPGHAGWLEAAGLFVACGLRPATLADGRVTGDRPAGVVPATVAEHLLQAGVRLWATVVVVGDGPWAASVARSARRLGTRVIAVSDHADWADDWADDRHPRPRQWSITGRDRVTGIRLEGETGLTELACDGVVLAGDPVPARNIEGAVLPGAAAVTFVQPLTPLDPAGRFHAGQHAARRWLHQEG
jgi:NADPH-dependent 2,4-dienoyl-CoA reductase/sulfur reductase-like enzyme